MGTEDNDLFYRRSDLDIKELERLANNDSILAIEVLAERYASGNNGVPKNIKYAADLYQVALDKYESANDVPPILKEVISSISYKLFLLFETGAMGFGQDVQRAMTRLLEVSAHEYHDPAACSKLADRYRLAASRTNDVQLRNKLTADAQQVMDDCMSARPTTPTNFSYYEGPAAYEDEVRPNDPARTKARKINTLMTRAKTIPIEFYNAPNEPWNAEPNIRDAKFVIPTSSIPKNVGPTDRDPENVEEVVLKLPDFIRKIALIPDASASTKVDFKTPFPAPPPTTNDQKLNSEKDSKTAANSKVTGEGEKQYILGQKRKTWVPSLEDQTLNSNENDRDEREDLHTIFVDATHKGDSELGSLQHSGSVTSWNDSVENNGYNKRPRLHSQGGFVHRMYL